MEFDREPGWEYKLGDGSMLLIAPNANAANSYLEQTGIRLQELGKQMRLFITHQGAQHRYEIKSEQSESPSTNQSQPSLPLPQPPEVPALVIPELDVDLNAIYTDLRPVYITQISNQKVLFANIAALRAQNKTPEEFLGESAFALNDPEELMERDLRISEASLNEYSYQGFRWYKTEEGQWLLCRMDFVSNFRKINFLGIECRLGMVLSASPVVGRDRVPAR